MMQLSRYDLSDQSGFLMPQGAGGVALPADFAEVRQVAADLPSRLEQSGARAIIEALREPAIEELLQTGSPAALRAALLDYSMLAQAYVWGESVPPTTLPAVLARPLAALAERLGEMPILSYASYVLANRQDSAAAAPLDPATLRPFRSFTGTPQEAWFIAIHAAIEAEAGGALVSALHVHQSAKQDDASACEGSFMRILRCWQRINALLDRMKDGCDPEFFFHRLRPYLNGWSNNDALAKGMIYEGVSRFAGRPQTFRGAAGSQSSLVRAMDLLLGLTHRSDPLTRYLDELDSYRPRQHRQFIADLAAQNDVRGYITASGSATLRAAFNDCIAEIALFRTAHLEYARSFVGAMSQQSPGNNPLIGTGGESFIEHLRAMRDSSQAQLL